MSLGRICLCSDWEGEGLGPNTKSKSMLKATIAAEE